MISLFAAVSFARQLTRCRCHLWLTKERTHIPLVTAPVFLNNWVQIRGSHNLQLGLIVCHHGSQTSGKPSLLLFYYKGYNWGTAKGKRCIATARCGEGSGPPSRHSGVFTNPGALWTLLFRSLMVASFCEQTWLNGHWWLSPSPASLSSPEARGGAESSHPLIKWLVPLTTSPPKSHR